MVRSFLLVMTLDSVLSLRTHIYLLIYVVVSISVTQVRLVVQLRSSTLADLAGRECILVDHG